MRNYIMFGIAGLLLGTGLVWSLFAWANFDTAWLLRVGEWSVEGRIGFLLILGLGLTSGVSLGLIAAELLKTEGWLQPKHGESDD